MSDEIKKIPAAFVDCRDKIKPEEIPPQRHKETAEADGSDLLGGLLCLKGLDGLDGLGHFARFGHQCHVAYRSDTEVR